MIKAEVVERALGEIKKGFAQYEYFFNQLNSPAWLEPLFEYGFFQSPPAPEQDGQTTSLPLWPESRYLARMSSRPEAQEVILKIVLAMPSTENSRVHDDLANIALAMPPSYAAKLVPQACEWVQSSFKLLLPERIANLIAHLAKGQEGGAALTLARAALALTPDPTFEAEKEQSLIRPDPQAHFGHYYYELILQKGMPELVRAVGIEAVGLCFDLLDDAIKYSMNPAHLEEGNEDYLYIRHPAIELKRSRDDIPGTLLRFARDSAEQLIALDLSQFRAVFQLLKMKRWASFRRLELHLCRLFPEKSRVVTEEFFQKPELLAQPSLRHEAVLLLKSSFSKFSEQTQQNILEWMDKEPSRERIQRWLEFVGQPVTEENIKTISDQQKRDLLSTLEGQLPQPYQRKLDGLVAAVGAARNLEETRKIEGGAFGPKSPKPKEELREMSVDHVISFLASWTPGASPFEPTAEGLGRDLMSIVVQKPVDFAVAAGAFKALDPTYVRSLFAGLTAALKGGEKFNWTPVLDLAVWVTGQPRAILGRKGDLFVRDPDWGWTRDSIIDLLQAAFEEHPGKLLPDNRQIVWQILRPLTQDPFPTTDDERGPDFDPGFLSINSTRGRAFHAIVQYALWVQQGTKPKSEDWRQNTLDEMPEVRDLLDKHLDPSLEPTLTIRSVYGSSLQWLARLDWRWLQDRLPMIFALSAKEVPQFRAAWDNFVAAWAPNATLLPVLLPYYRRAIEQIGNPIGKMLRPADPDDGLSEHLMVFYWWGTLDSETGEALLTDFYKTAPDQLRAHAMWFVGRSVSDWKDDIPEAVFARLQTLFEKRLQIAHQSASIDDFRSELMGFGWWFASSKFDDEWTLRALIAVLQLTNKVADDMDVVKRLSQLASKYPDECITCLSLMVKGDRDRWLLVGVEKETEELLAAALNSGTARDPARRLIEDLISRGHFGFRSLLRPTTKT